MQSIAVPTKRMNYSEPNQRPPREFLEKSQERSNL
jgi:hypothetical protein